MFVVHALFATPDDAKDVIAADFNGDGHLDFAAGASAIVRLGDGLGGFSAAPDLPLGARPLTAVDFNGDGFLDIAAADFDTTLTILLGDGAGGFTAGPTATVTRTAQAIAVGDLDNDGNLDLVVAAANGYAMNLLEWQSGALVDMGSMPAPGTSYEAELADLNGDGVPDLVVAEFDYGANVYLGVGDGTFGPRTSIGASPAESISSVAIADFDGNGDLDVAVNHGWRNIVSVRFNDGAGGFTSGIAISAPSAEIRAADVDGDGDMDIIAMNSAGLVTPLINDGAGAFTAGVTGNAGSAWNAVTGDLDGDGRLDLIVAGFMVDQVAVMLSTGLYITADSPAAQAEGQTYTFTVERYGVVADAITVDWTVTGSGAALANSADFAGPMSGVLSFAAGQTTATITIDVAADASFEPDETFQVTLSNASGGLAIETAVATAVILNDDDAPTPRPIPDAGGEGDDLAILNDSPNSYSAGDGDDLAMGDGGADTLHGNTGNDTLYGGSGEDWLRGGQGGDVLYGDDGDDLQFGDLGDDLLHGGRGDDTLEGGDGSDGLAGGQGDDVLWGGAGDDVLSGDKGNDTLTGGDGADLFRVFAGSGDDVVTDFTAQDRVQVVGGYSVSQAGAGVVVQLDGGSLTLQGVQLAVLPDGWIFG